MSYPDIEVHRKSNDKNRVFVVFSDNFPNPPKGKFAWKHALVNFDVNVIYVRDAGSQWYNRGIEGVGTNIQESSKFLLNLINDLGFEDVTTFGASMGGYGALLFGRLLKANNTIAISPQTMLAPPYPRYDNDLHSGEYADIQDLESFGNEYIIASRDDLYDTWSACRLKDKSPNLRLFLVNGYCHLVPRCLLNDKLLEDFLVRIFTNQCVWLPPSVSLVNDPVPDLSFLLDSFYNDDYVSALEIAKELYRDNEDWAGLVAMLGKLEGLGGNKDLQWRFYELATTLNPAMYEQQKDLSLYYARNNRYSSAVRAASEALKINIGYNSFLEAKINEWKSSIDKRD